MTAKIHRLTPEQIDLICSHTYKWKNIALSTERIDRKYTKTVIDLVHKMLGYEQPIILFFDSPYAASNFIASQTAKQLKNTFGRPRAVDLDLSSLHRKFRDEIYSKVDFRAIYSQAKQSNFQNKLYFLKDWKEYGRWEAFDEQIDNNILARLDRESIEKVEEYFGRPLWRFVRPGFRVASIICQLDYYISTCELLSDIKKWKIYSSLFQLSNHIYLQEKACMVCERPLHMSFDSDAFLHAEGEPAIKFADGSRLYSYHRVTLPEKYGKIKPSNWQSKWLFDETNELIREALVKGLGYQKIRNELSTVETDKWHNFVVVAIELNINHTLVYLIEININTLKIERAKEVPNNVATFSEALSYTEGVEEWETVLIDL